MDSQKTLQPKLRAQIRSSKGSVELFSNDGLEPVATVCFAAHLADWKWVGPKGRQKSATASSTANPSCAGQQIAYSMLDGLAGPIDCETRVWAEKDELMVPEKIEVEAVPRVAPELNICHVSVTVYLPSAIWEDGVMHVETPLRLPAKGSAPRQDCNLFQTPPEGSSNCLSKFSASTRSDVKLEFLLEPESCSRKVRFVDVRKWGPSFEVRMGDLGGKFDWQPNSPRVWRIRVRAPASKLQFESISAALSPAELDHLKQKGFVLVSNLIPPDAVKKALRAVNRSLGKGFPSDAVGTFNAQSWCPDLKNSPLLTSLFNNTKVRGIVESLLGAENVRDAGGVQVALRFPNEPPARGITQLGHHIDGIPTDTNGLEKGKLYPFNLLVGVYLQDVLEDDSGNLVVFPGSHIQHASYFKEHSAETILSQGLPPIDKTSGVQIRARAGDVVIAHYLLAHTIASNVSHNIRYALYFRVSVPNLGKGTDKYEMYHNLWCDWPGVKA